MLYFLEKMFYNVNKFEFLQTLYHICFFKHVWYFLKEAVILIKCEMHLHTLGGSPCAKVMPENIAEIYSEAGYGAITVTNHYMKYIFESFYPFSTDKERIKYFISHYKTLEKCCKPFGIKVFLGMELNPEIMNAKAAMPAAEFLCYGVTEKFLYDYPRLYNYTQKELFELFDKNNILMFQAHPFRGYCTLGDLKYMHGVETFNGFHESFNHKSEDLAKENNLLRVSGSDFHEKGVPNGGIYIPDSIDSSEKLAHYIKNNKIQLIRNGYES